MITKIDSRQNIAFKSAQVNILATADNHGNLSSIPLLTETIKANKSDIFIKSDGSAEVATSTSILFIPNK